MVYVSAISTSIRCRAKDILPQLEASREGLLIRRHDADALLQEQGVAVRDILVARVVDQHDLSWGFDEVFSELREREGLFGGCLELGCRVLPAVEGLVVGVIEGLFGGGQPDEGDVGG